jgi:hypothetical protein
MQLGSFVAESIRRMGSGDNITTNISERLHIANVKEANRSSNKVNYIQQILKHNDWCTGLDYVEETVSYPALKHWYQIDSAELFNLLSTPDKQRSKRQGHLASLPSVEENPIIRLVL